MRPFVPYLLAVIVLGAAVVAQESLQAQSAEKPATAAATPSPAEKPGTAKTGQTKSSGTAKAATPAPATPGPKKPNIFKRMFGKKPAATPAPKVAAATPAATPAPVTHARKPHKPAEQPNESTAAAEGGTPPPEKAPSNETPPPADTEKTPATETPAHTEPVPPTATPAPKKGNRRKGAAVAETKAPAGGESGAEGSNPEASEKLKYDDARARAMEDPHVKDLKQKADNAALDEDGKKAMRAYYKALFQKIRSLGDENVKSRCDRMEAFVLKDLAD